MRMEFSFCIFLVVGTIVLLTGNVVSPINLCNDAYHDADHPCGRREKKIK